jgi:aspartate kinase
MSLLSIAILARGYDAVSFTGSQSGIITNDRHFDARIIEVRPHRIEDELARGRIVIVAGYQGMSYKREITTLGRGGSDTTALALAAALGAVRAEIYSDVDGVYSADPRVVPDARHLPELDYATMQEMAECGAKVLNAQAVEWARKSRIAIHARKTGDLTTSRETVVSPDTESDADAARRAVVVQKKIAQLQAPLASLPRLLETAARLGLPLGDLASVNGAVVLWAPLLNVPDWIDVRRQLAALLPELEIREELGLASLVGVEIGSRPELVARALGSVRGQPLMIASSALRLSVVLTESECEPTVRSWHSELVAPAGAQPSSGSGPGGTVSPVS